MKLLDQVCQVARLRRLALETERCYARWIEQYIRFHKTAEGGFAIKRRNELQA